MNRCARHDESVLCFVPKKIRSIKYQCNRSSVAEAGVLYCLLLALPNLTIAYLVSLMVWDVVS